MTKLPAIKAVIILPTEKEDRTLYLLLEDFEFNGVVVPKGFVSDGATIPRIFWAILPPVDRYFPAALVHDYLLGQVDRDEADAAFKESLKLLNIRRYRIYSMYGAVRLYSNWKKLLTKIKNLL